MCRNVLTAARSRPGGVELLGWGKRNPVSPFQLDRSNSPFCCRGQPALSSADFDPLFSDALPWRAAGGRERGVMVRVLEQRRCLLRTILSPSPSVFASEDGWESSRDRHCK